MVCEGEKATDAAAELGLLATTSPHGSKSAGKADWAALAGREVVILPDHDEAGKQYAGDVANILAKLTPAATVRIVNLADAWPDLPSGGDMADVVAAGEDADTIKAKLARLVDKATPHPGAAGPVLVCLADVAPREIKWLWPGRVPMGRITLLVGRPGEGKSFLTTDMAARITTGTPWPDRSDCPAGSVILISAEDDPGDTIRPRLDAHYADVRKVHLLSAVRRLGEDGQPYEVLFTLADVAALETALKTLPDCRLIVVDPIGSFLGGDTDAHLDNEVRGVLAPVAKLAERYGPAVLVVAHRRKSAGSIADDLALGSRAFTGIARAVKWKLIEENPFADVKAGSQTNKARMFFVTRDMAQKVLDACPDTQWRLLFALSRYGGLRCPSEHLALRWGDVDWEHSRIRIRSSKTEHHEGGDCRIIPLFPELRPYLQQAFDEAEPGTEYVITRYRDVNANLRTQLERIINRAGLKTWPKLFHNLRSTRQTELAERYPIHVVCQ